MDRIRGFLKKNPIAGWALVLVFIAASGYLLASRLFGGGAPPAAVTPPAPSAVTRPAASPAPAPAVTQTPAPAPVATPPSGSKVPAGPVGRADPFIPLVKSGTGGAGRSTPPPPPSVALPPPPFPTPGNTLPPPPLPGGGTPPPLPGGGVAPSPGDGLAVTGIVGDSNAIAIIVVGGKTAIVGAGDELGDLRVLRVDPTRRTVTFLRAGKRFDVRMGGE